MATDKWIRTCQECGHKQEERNPPVQDEEPSDAYRNRKCKRCHSEALDYGRKQKPNQEEA